MNRKIIINGRFLCNKTDGISRFSLEICKELKKHSVNFEILIPYWLEYENPEGFNLKRYGKLKSHFWEQINLKSYLKKNGRPLLLNFSGLGPLFYKNQLVTIHDLSFFENKKWFSWSYSFVYRMATPIIAKSALKIITVSEFSKKEIIKNLKIDNNKIEVIHNAVSEQLESTSGCQITDQISALCNKKIILAVSSIDPRKNLKRLIDSFLELEYLDYSLVLVGKKSPHFNINLKSNSERVFFTGYVSDDDLIHLYKNCQFFIYPSLYEGFGIPPLEAMRNSCPVIVSKIPSIEEVCADAAVYVDPYNNEDISRSMKELIKNGDLRRQMSVKGYQRSLEFSWSKSAEKLKNLLNEIYQIN